MEIIKNLILAWAIFALITGTVCALLGAPFLALFPFISAAVCAYSASLIDEILE